MTELEETPTPEGGSCPSTRGSALRRLFSLFLVGKPSRLTSRWMLLMLLLVLLTLPVAVLFSSVPPELATVEPQRMER